MTPRVPAGRPEPYRGAVIAVGTRHGKAEQLAPAFRRHLGANLLTPPDLDTDQFGTFSGWVCGRPGCCTDWPARPATGRFPGPAYRDMKSF